MRTLTMIIWWSLTAAVSLAQTFKTVPTASNISWTGYAEAGSYAPTGSIKVKNGLISLKNGKLQAGGFLIIDMASINQENKELENHLKNDDFFAVDKFKTATFKISQVKGGIMSGIMTIKGISKAINFPYSLRKSSKGYVFSASLQIDRTQFNIKYNSSSYFQDLGNYAIKNEFDLNMCIVFN